MPWWTWLCLGIFLFALVATAIFAAVAFSRLRGVAAAAEEIQARIDEVAAAAEETQRRQTRLAERLAELERRRARTEASLARLRLLTSSVSEVFDEVTGLERRHLRK